MRSLIGNGILQSVVCVPAILTAVCLCGCGGGGSDVDLNSVAGTVTMDGKPLGDAQVIYTPKAGGRPSFGLTDEDGYYELGYSADGMGTPPGEYLVSIRTHRAPEEDPTTGEMSPAVPETVPSIYNSESTLEVKVPGGDYDFELKSDAGTVVQPESDPDGVTDE